MIYDNNSTALGTLDIPVIEGYDYATGTARALIESARNDYAMFKAMIRLDHKEARLNESAGYVTEGEIMSLSEAATGGIWQKIVDTLKKLIAKVKSIFSNFIARLTGLFAKDATLIKKYEKQVIAKGSKVNNMKVKFAKIKKDPINTDIGTVSALHELPRKENKEEMLKANLGGKDSKAEYAEAFHEEHFGDEETDELASFGTSISNVIVWLKGHDKTLNALKKQINKFEKDTGKMVRDAEKEISNRAKKVADNVIKGDNADKAIDGATKTYDATLCYQEAILWKHKCILDAVSYEYKLYKAVFMKAVTVNVNKIEEAAFDESYIDESDLIAEAAANEVEEVLMGTIRSEELSDICNASKEVLGDGVDNSYYSMEYDKCSHYTPDRSEKSTDGTINTKYNSRCESAMFGELLY